MKQQINLKIANLHYPQNDPYILWIETEEIKTFGQLKEYIERTMGLPALSYLVFSDLTEKYIRNETLLEKYTECQKSITFQIVIHSYSRYDKILFYPKLEQTLARNQAPSQKTAADLEWGKIKETKSSKGIAHFLVINRYVSNDLTTPLVVKNPFKTDSYEIKSLIEILISHLELNQDTIFIDFADYLITQGAHLPPSVKPKEEEQRSTYFSRLVGSVSKLYLALRNDPSLITQQDENGDSLLHHAARIIAGSNERYLIQYLLFTAPGVNLNIANNQKNTPFHDAAQSGTPYLFNNYLSEALRNKINLKCENSMGMTPINLALNQDSLDNYENSLVEAIKSSGFDWNELFHKAVSSDHINAVSHLLNFSYTYFLYDNQVGLNKKQSGSTPLHIALKNKHLKIARMLICSGASLSEKDQQGRNAFHIANHFLKEKFDEYKKQPPTPKDKAKANADILALFLIKQFTKIDLKNSSKGSALLQLFDEVNQVYMTDEKFQDLLGKAKNITYQHRDQGWVGFFKANWLRNTESYNDLRSLFGDSLETQQNISITP